MVVLIAALGDQYCYNFMYAIIRCNIIKNNWQINRTVMDNYGQSWAVITYQKSAKISKDLKNLEISNFQIEEFKNMYRTFQIFKSRN